MTYKRKTKLFPLALYKSEKELMELLAVESGHKSVSEYLKSLVLCDALFLMDDNSKLRKEIIRCTNNEDDSSNFLKTLRQYLTDSAKAL